MQTKKRTGPMVPTVDEMDKAQHIAHPPAKRPKKVYPSEYVRVPGTIVTDTDAITIGQEIGKGTFSKCFYAYSTETRAVFAIKAQRIKQCSGSTKLRIEREMFIHSYASKHKSVTKYMGSYKDEHNLYIQLELCSNGDMNSYIKSHGAFSMEKSWKLMRSICSGIDFLHSRRILHRDIKLANVFLTASLEPKLGDFGLAYELPPGDTRKFSKAGTPAYMAPELSFAPHVCSTSSDIWALGVMWFAMVYNVLPFNAPTTEETCKLVARGYFKIPDSPDSTAEFRKLITMILSFDSTKRPNSHQLMSFLKMDPFKSPELPAKAIKRNGENTMRVVETCRCSPSHRYNITRMGFRPPSSRGASYGQSLAPKTAHDWENQIIESPKRAATSRRQALAPGTVFSRSPRRSQPLVSPSRI